MIFLFASIIFWKVCVWLLQEVTKRNHLMISTLIQAPSSLSQLKMNSQCPLIILFPLHSHLSLTLFKASLFKRVNLYLLSLLNNYSLFTPVWSHSQVWSTQCHLTDFCQGHLQSQNARSKGYFSILILLGLLAAFHKIYHYFFLETDFLLGFNDMS